MFSEPMWKPVKELCIGDYIGIPIIQEQENPHNITEDDVFILGRYIADGHTAKKNYRMSKGKPQVVFGDYTFQLVATNSKHSKRR